MMDPGKPLNLLGVIIGPVKMYVSHRLDQILTACRTEWGGREDTPVNTAN